MLLIVKSGKRFGGDGERKKHLCLQGKDSL